MRTKKRKIHSSTPSPIFRVIVSSCLIAGLAMSSAATFAGPLEQARRMHDRLTGVPPTPEMLNDMASLINGDCTDCDGPVEAAKLAITPNYTPPAGATINADNSASLKAFYGVTLKNFATPMTNEEQTVHAPLNDYSATVIGLIRDGGVDMGDGMGLIGYDQVLYGDVAYVRMNGSNPAYSHNDNNDYETMESNHDDLSDPTVLSRRTQTSLSMAGSTAGQSAGIMTTRAAGMAFFKDGTNRAMFAFTVLNHLCRNIEEFKDNTRVVDRIRQDVSRSPGGDSSIYMNHCVACHAGMDPMAQAYAYFEWVDTTDNDIDDGNVSYVDTMGLHPGKTLHKYLINAGNFEFGYVTPDDSWDNYWREGPNATLNWNFNPALSPDGTGSGPKSMGQELAATEAFAQCQVEKVYKTVCLQEPKSDDATTIETLATEFRDDGYNMRNVFAKVAPMCMGD